MGKDHLSEQKLLHRINSALEKDSPHPEHRCRVESLKKAIHSNRNWAVDTDSTSGVDLLHVDKCNTLRERVLDELASKYDVSWPS